MKQLRRLAAVAALLFTLAMPAAAIKRPSNEPCQPGQVCELPCDPTKGECTEAPQADSKGTVLSDFSGAWDGALLNILSWLIA